MSESEQQENGRRHYHIDRWGGGYFKINDEGGVRVHPFQDEQFIDVVNVVEEAKERSLEFPLVIRFQDLLRHRVKSLNEAFLAAIEEFGYDNVYRGVFPVKVNQLREVVEEIVDAGKPYHYGLEAGSKPELIAALAVHEDPESLIVCNGCKDKMFIRYALMGRKLEKKIIIVIEKLDELYDVLEIAEEMGVEPILGVRLKLLSKGAGKWATSGGENAKFGLSTSDLVEMSKELKRRDQENILKLVHFHVGSQVPDIRTVKNAVREATRFYAKLQQMGHPLEYIDVGGGLAVDYEGARSTSDSSMNYTMEEYARDVVYNIKEICELEKVRVPTIVSESGRALVAHHSILVAEIYGSIEKSPNSRRVELEENDHKLVRDIWELQQSISGVQRQENLHDAKQIKEETQSLFELGMMDLESKAKVELLFWQVCEEILEQYEEAEHLPEEIRDLKVDIADQFLCNFSVFQSLLDHWALGQLFPVMPLTGLLEDADRDGTLVDITCDSDGKVAKFIGLNQSNPTLPMKRFKNGEPYHVGFFLVGAYQDIMGDFHNLFGRATEVHVFLDEDEELGHYIEEVIEGSCIGSVLAMTQWDNRYLVRLFKAQVDDAIRSDRIKPKEGMRLLARYERALSDHTYLRIEA